ncbi:MAG: hypothetical protein ABSA12_12170 [Verrucomicrobiia bacterium]
MRTAALETYKVFFDHVYQLHPNDLTQISTDPGKTASANFVNGRLQQECVFAADLLVDLLQEGDYDLRWFKTLARELAPLPFLYAAPKTLKGQAQKTGDRMLYPVDNMESLRSWLQTWQIVLAPRSALVSMARHFDEHEYHQLVSEPIWRRWCDVSRIAGKEPDHSGLPFVLFGLDAFLTYVDNVVSDNPTWRDWRQLHAKLVEEWISDNKAKLEKDGQFYEAHARVDALIRKLATSAPAAPCPQQSPVDNAVDKPATSDKGQQAVPRNPFFFTTLDGTVVAIAKDKHELKKKLNEVPVAYVARHANRGDFTNWLNYLGDPELGAKVLGVRGEPDAVRTQIVALIEAGAG